MAKELSVLQQQAEAIKNEVNKGANTANRVGSMFSDMLDYNEEQSVTDKANTGISTFPVFSEVTAYTVDQVVNYNGKLYKFTADHPAGAWNSAHVAPTSLKEIQDEKLTELDNKLYSVDKSVCLRSNTGKFIDFRNDDNGVTVTLFANYILGRYFNYNISSELFANIKSGGDYCVIFDKESESLKIINYIDAKTENPFNVVLARFIYDGSKLTILYVASISYSINGAELNIQNTDKKAEYSLKNSLTLSSESINNKNQIENIINLFNIADSYKTESNYILANNVDGNTGNGVVFNDLVVGQTYSLHIQSSKSLNSYAIVTCDQTWGNRTNIYDGSSDLKDGITITFSAKYVNQGILVYTTEETENNITSITLYQETDNTNIKYALTDKNKYSILQSAPKGQILTSGGINLANYSLIKQGKYYKVHIYANKALTLSTYGLLGSDSYDNNRYTIYNGQNGDLYQGVDIIYRAKFNSEKLGLYTNDTIDDTEVYIDVLEYDVQSVSESPFLNSKKNLIDRYWGYIINNSIEVGKSFSVEKGTLCKLLVTTSNNLQNYQNSILIADECGENRITLFDCQGINLGIGKEFIFRSPHKNCQILYYVTGADVSNTPYVNIELYAISSDTMSNVQKSTLLLDEKVYQLSKVTSDLAKKINDVSYSNNKRYNFDVCILGAGSAGCHAAIALNNSGYNVCIIDKNTLLGGTLSNAWINCCAPAVDTPIFKEMFTNMFLKGTAKFVDENYQRILDNQNLYQYDRTLLRSDLRTDGKSALSIILDVDAIDKEYIKHMSNISKFLGYTFKNATHESGKVTSITISKDEIDYTIEAKIFIDCSGDSHLVRSINGIEDIDFYLGQDAKNKYLSEYGFEESYSGDTDIKSAVNYPTLMYRVIEGTEDLSDVNSEGLSYYMNPYFYPDASFKYFYENSSLELDSPAMVSGESVFRNGEEQAISKITPFVKPHWKYLKTNGITTYANIGLPRKKFDSVAPMLGIREGARIACERMLSQDDMFVRFTPDKVFNSNNTLDKYIAIGSHICDLHIQGSVNTTEINKRIVPYGVKFGSLVPKKLKNVLVASRGAGFTHIGAGSFRLNKDMMQIGYVAGFAASDFLNNKREDIRYIDVNTVVMNTELKETVTTINNL